MNKKSLLKLTLIAIALFAASVPARAESSFDEAPTPAGLEGFMAAQTLLALLRRTDNPRRLAGATQRRIGRIDLGGWQADLAAPRAFGRVEVAMLTRNGRLI